MTGGLWRPAVFTDAPLIRSMEEACFGPSDAFSLRQVRSFLRNPHQSIITDLILDGNEPAGWASWFTRKGCLVIRLYSLCMLPTFTGRGLAKAYMTACISRFAGPYRTMSLEVRTENSRAIALYEKLGFTTLEKLPGYYPDGADGLRMRRPL